MKIPFNLNPVNWLLRGEKREIAKAKDSLSGYELDKRILEITIKDKKKLEEELGNLNAKQILEDYETKEKLIRISEQDPIIQNRKIIELKHSFKFISDKEYELMMAESKLSGTILSITKLEIERKYDRMTDVEFEKKKANILGEPFISIVKSGYSPDSETGLYFEFDWNDHWINKLEENGYVGVSEDAIIQKWFEDLCRGVIADLQLNDPPSFNRPRIVSRRDDSGNTTYR